MQLTDLGRYLRTNIITLLAVIILAVWAGYVIGLGNYNLGIVLIAAILAFMILTRLDVSKMLLLVNILVSATSLSFWLQHRLRVRGFPITLPDLLVLAYGFYGFFRWAHGGRIKPFGMIDKLVIIWFLYNSFVGLGIGLYIDNPLYAQLQEYRVVLYAAISYLTTMVIFHPKRHLPVLLWGILIAGVIVSAWQLGISISGRNNPFGEVVFIGTNYLGRTLRDVNLPLYFAGPALMVLAATQFEAPALLGRMRLLWWGLVPLLVAAPVLSMTRTVWVALGLSLLLVMIYLVWYGSIRRRLTLVILASVIAVLLILVVINLIQFFLPNVLNGISTTFHYTMTGIDSTRTGRLSQSLQLLNLFLGNGWKLLTGIGFGNMQSGAISIGIYNNLHNAYLSYMVIGGLPGFILYLLLWFSPVPTYYRLLFHPKARTFDPLVRVYALASLVNWMMLTAIMTVMPLHWAEAAWFGINLAVASILGKSTHETPIQTIAEKISIHE